MGEIITTITPFEWGAILTVLVPSAFGVGALIDIYFNI